MKQIARFKTSCVRRAWPFAVACMAGAVLLGTATGVQAQETAWSDDLDCLVCHTRQADALADAGTLVVRHESLACIDCHNDAETLAKMHRDVEGGQRIPKTLKQTNVPNEVCLGCHATTGAAAQGGMEAKDAPEVTPSGSGTSKDVADNTPAVTDSQANATAGEATASASPIPAVPQGVVVGDANGLQVDVHNLPANSDHATVTCGDCHTMHNGKDAQKNASKVCTTCHHKNVFECHTCH